MSTIPDDAEFLRMCQYFQQEKGDMARYVFWDDLRLERLRPDIAVARDEARRTAYVLRVLVAGMDLVI